MGIPYTVRYCTVYGIGWYKMYGIRCTGMCIRESYMHEPWHLWFVPMERTERRCNKLT